MKRIFYFIFAFGFIIDAGAQDYVPVHDEMLFNQFSSMEVSYGNLTPEWWYKLLNKNYYTNIAHEPTRGMQALRSHAARVAGQQVEMADSVHQVMKERELVELTNLADRQFDLVWEVEKEKIEPLLNQFKKNMNYIMVYGGSTQDYKEWQLICKCIEDGITATHKAYLANSKRHHQYLAIYKDLKERNQSLMNYLQKMKSLKDFKEMTERSKKPGRPDVKSIARQAHGRWLVAMSETMH